MLLTNKYYREANRVDLSFFDDEVGEFSDRGSECPHPARTRHEEYVRSDGTTHCRACGAEFGPLPKVTEDG